MVEEDKFEDVSDEDEPKNDDTNNHDSKSSKKFSKSMIAGIILIIAGLFFIFALIPFLTIDFETIDEFRENDEQFREFAQNKTNEEIKNDYFNNGIIGLAIAFFPLLGGVFALLKKGWLISLFGGIVGIIFSGVLIVIALSLIAFIILIFARKEFQKIIIK